MVKTIPLHQEENRDILYKQMGNRVLKALSTDPRVGSIDHPYGKQKGRRQPRELGQFQQFFF